MRVRILVSGHVQGVFFRESTRRQAEALGVAGWVRNLPDGRVEALFEGSGPRVEELVLWCHRGPPAARVEAVQRFDDELAPSRPPVAGGFQVLRSGDAGFTNSTAHGDA